MPRYVPPKRNPKPIRMTPRDDAILEMMYAFDGMMSRRQIATLFFDGKDNSSVRSRLRALVDHRYIAQPDVNQASKQPMGEWVYWLAKKGTERVVGKQGRGLTRADDRYHKKPNWNTVDHPLQLNYFRIMVMQAAKANDKLELRSWVTDSQFRSWKDKVEFEDETGKRQEQIVIPDAFFIVAARHPTKPGWMKFGFLVELDRGNESIAKRIRPEKIVRGMAYLRSDVYTQRLGVKFGRWLMVTQYRDESEGTKRMHNMREVADSVGGAWAFYFTTFSQLSAGNILTGDVWLQADKDEPLSIISPQ